MTVNQRHNSSLFLFFPGVISKLTGRTESLKSFSPSPCFQAGQQSLSLSHKNTRRRRVHDLLCYSTVMMVGCYSQDISPKSKLNSTIFKAAFHSALHENKTKTKTKEKESKSLLSAIHYLFTTFHYGINLVKVMIISTGFLVFVFQHSVY